MSDPCACRCCCWSSRSPDCDRLCEGCWREWCGGSAEHGPAADSSYMGTYGLTGVGTGWLISIGAGDLVSQPAGFISRYVVPPRCPDPFCRAPMVPRPGAWKCYRQEGHSETVVVPMTLKAPRSPQLKVI